VTEWKKYPGDRLISENKEGFFVIKPIEDILSTATPVFCPVCTKLMTSYYDELSYEKFKCCDSCANTWAYSRHDDWHAGWRPSKEEIQKSVESRPRR
jgi:hypothetical protein